MQCNKQGDRLELGFLGLEVRRKLRQHGFLQPYAAAGPVLATTELRVQSAGIDADPHLLGGSVMVGSDVGQHAFLEARYLAVPRVHGFNLSGTNLRAGIRF